ncbi:uncharacterized protein EHS24_002677 [Apiotrichum porosum]|uniref:Dolichyl-diphosphooligosaccharide--protein glycosyltransferase subunit 4 n=1 Tax=Apiotrichum porosum TaxID=105984 RepID=A0A427XHA9_9TREE|nr:uncharacterized protein EHS24_002677 [Apiotrichum porosum]RSH78216.1 hypothetical protein EHS24_002677 [Apiotrichum porosum]
MTTTPTPSVEQQQQSSHPVKLPLLRPTISFYCMISDGTLTDISNGLGVAAMVLIVVYHFVAVNGKRMQD